MQPEEKVILPDAAVVKGLHVWGSVQRNLMSLFHEFSLQDLKLCIHQCFSAKKGLTKLNPPLWTQGSQKIHLQNYCTELESLTTCTSSSFLQDEAFSLMLSWVKIWTVFWPSHWVLKVASCPQQLGKIPTCPTLNVRDTEKHPEHSNVFSINCSLWCFKGHAMSFQWPEKCDCFIQVFLIPTCLDLVYVNVWGFL